MAMLPLVLVISIAAPAALAQKPVTPPPVSPPSVSTPAILPSTSALPTPAVAVPTAPVEPHAATPVVITADRITLSGNASLEMQSSAEARQEALARRALEVEQAAQAERELQDLRHALEQLELERRKVALDRRRHLTDDETRHVELTTEYERMRTEIQASGLGKEHPATVQRLATLRALEQQLTAAHRQRELDEEEAAIKFDELKLRERMLRESAAHLGTLRDLAPADQIAAGDRLTIRIDSEPGLPTAFTVAADGSIRYPFLGAMTVTGQTTTQVTDALSRMLSERGLKQHPRVTVTASRRQ